MDLQSKNVIYIGGFGGIGQKCLYEFLLKGIKCLAIFDLCENAAYLKELQQTFPIAEIFFIQMDITLKSSIELAYQQAAQQMTHFDIVVNGCGLMNDREIDLTIQVNLLGVINSTLAAITYMDKSKGGLGGLIVNISSVAGLEPINMVAVYSAAKFGVTAFTRSLANPFYYARFGIDFITICPGFTDTALLHNPHDKTTFIFETPMTKRFAHVQRQTADACAKQIIKAIELCKNGAVWIVDLGELNEVEFPVYWKPTAKS